MVIFHSYVSFYRRAHDDELYTNIQQPGPSILSNTEAKPSQISMAKRSLDQLDRAEVGLYTWTLFRCFMVIVPIKLALFGVYRYTAFSDTLMNYV